MADPLQISSSLTDQVVRGMLGGEEMRQNRARLAQSQQQVDQGQQRVDLEKQQEERAQREADLKLHDYLTQVGAMPGDAQTGLINDSQVLPHIPGFVGGGATVPIVRKMDPARTVKFKDSGGRDVAYEIPTMPQQVLAKFKAEAPVREGTVQQRQSEAQATATGTAAGQTAGRINDLQQRGRPMDPELAKYFNWPQDLPILPEQQELLSQHYATVNAAQVRGDGAAARQKATLDSRQTLQNQRLQAQADLNQTRLNYQNQWQQARQRLQTGSSGVQGRFDARQFDTNQKEHGRLVDQLYKEQQKQLEAQAVLDEQDSGGFLGFGGGKQPVTPDGQEFTDPFSGKKLTMNYAQRLRLKNALEASQKQMSGLSERADTIAQKYGIGGDAAAAAPNAAGNAGGSAGTSPAKPATAKPAAGGSAQQYKAGDVVQDGNGKRFKVRGYNGAGKLLADPLP